MPDGLVVERAPEVEAGQRAVRAPGLRDALELGRGGRRVEPVEDLGRLADPEVAHRQHVRPAQVEDQEHVDRPRTESLDRDQLLGHLLVGQLRELIQAQLAVLDVLGEVPQERHLRARETGCGPHLLGVRVEELGRSGSVAAEVRNEPLEDAPGGLGRELLANDRPHEGPVGVSGAPAARRAHLLGVAEAPDQLGQERVRLPQVLDRARLLGHGSGARPRARARHRQAAARSWKPCSAAPSSVEGGSPNSHSRAIRCQLAVAPS